MDKIWYRNPSKSEVIGRCGGDEKKGMTTQNRHKSNAKKNKKTIPTGTKQNVHTCCNVFVIDDITYTVPFASGCCNE